MFLLRQAFLDVPRELVDAGIIDGCAWWQLTIHVSLPPAVPLLFITFLIFQRRFKQSFLHSRLK